MLGVVHARVDAFTIAFRTTIDDPISASLVSRGQLAFHHGRVAIGIGCPHGDLCKCQTLDHAWELRYSRTPRRWLLTREEHARVLVDLQAPGGKRVIVDEDRYRFHDRKETMIVPDVRGGPDRKVQQVDWLDDYKDVEEPGWTIEIVYAAQYLADRSLMSVVSEARTLARTFGKVYQERVRRIDLCADMAGWIIRQVDRTRLVTRSRLRMDPKTSGEVRLFEDPLFEKGDELAEASLHARRAITGITVGRGDVMCRMYDKQEELGVKLECEPNEKARANLKDKAAKEVARWKAGGWNGIDPVTRVEFQIRGAALREFGVHEAENIVDPIIRKVRGGNANQKEETEARVLETRERGIGTYDIEGYLPRLWSSVCGWLKLAKPTRSRSGDLLQRTRWTLDQRWKVLREVSWNRENGMQPFPWASLGVLLWGAVLRPPCDREPIKRVRDRSPVSSTQAVGALASLAAASGRIDHDHEEDGEKYGTPSEAFVTLMLMLRSLCEWGVEEMAADLIVRWGSPNEAASHLAIRLNAARGRFAARVREGPEPRIEEWPWLRSGQLESGKAEH